MFIIGSLYGKDQGIFIVETLFFLVGMVRSPIMDSVPIILGQPLLYLGK
ncbi:hypothetical protein SLEP1_g58063 [Rubroshorea leprosula]|uniref:Uncharacterized protein n=1 Tax=Rubroshorea leprosula TaxID=152421 RepID=A0AAV5MRP3_9ROSI|nr:hypothetical protein SLEP1_g58063 [Rubroshorea leprosula]